MSHTNSTSNYGLPQWIGTDKPTFLGDFNTAFYDIDAQMKANADASASATTTANTAASAATTASTNATTALNTANSAASEAASATSAAASATATANTAATNAATALTASQANNIANLAPAYDPTLTYAVGDLVTYVDTETNTGKLYKCIVAVASPMAFNINFWDDVTTSELYKEKKRLVNEYTTIATDTYASMLQNVVNGITFDKDKDYTLDIDFGTTRYKLIGQVFETASNSIRFSNVTYSYGANAIEVYVYNVNAVQSRVYKLDANTSGNTLSEVSSDPMSAGFVLKLYEN